jgi:hypothetical protein
MPILLKEKECIDETPPWTLPNIAVAPQPSFTAS